MQEAIKSTSASVAFIAKQSKDVALTIMTIQISELILFFNVGKSMGPAQIKATIDMLLDDVVTKNLKPDDYKVIFDGMRKGYYGNLYDRFDGQIIFKIVCEYADKRQSFIETESINQAQRIKETPIVIHPEVMKAYKEGLDSLPKNNVTKKEVDLNKMSPSDPVITEIFAEFDAVWKKNPVKGIGRFIEYNGKTVNQIEYLETRLKESFNA